MNYAEQYDGDYFLRGRETGKSLYENYRWMPELTTPMVQAMAKHCGIRKGARVLDFGCARGYTVKALRGLGYDAWGVDVSKWAIDNADEGVKEYVNQISGDERLLTSRYDWIIAKDVLEHIPFVHDTIVSLMIAATEGILAVVPLSRFSGARYVIDQYEEDSTHVQRHTLTGWAEMFLATRLSGVVDAAGWSVEASYRMPGVKDNYWKPGWERGNGFLTCRRIG